MKSHIIFVHGWRWQGDISKTHCENTFQTVSDTIEEYASGCSFWYYNYRTGPYRFPPQKGNKDFILNARELLNEIGRVIDVYRGLSGSEPSSESDELKIFLIGHSAGGLVIRQALTTAHEIPSSKEILPYVKNVILIASPATGTPLLEIPKEILENDEETFSLQLKQLAPSSDFIMNLNPRWSSWTQQFTNCKVNCIYGNIDKIAPPPSLQENCIPNPPNNCMRDKKCVVIDGVGHTNILNCSVFTTQLKNFLIAAGL
jgi:pimeloyl-ACP methyl ester carboxylesterase